MVKISAGNNIVAFFVFRLQKFSEHFCLCGFALAVVIGFQVEIDNNKTAVTSFNGAIAYQKAAFEICSAYRPTKRAGKSNALGRFNPKIGNGHKTAVHFAYCRKRKRNISAAVIKRKGGVFLNAGKIVFPLVYAEAAF